MWPRNIKWFLNWTDMTYGLCFHFMPLWQKAQNLQSLKYINTNNNNNDDNSKRGCWYVLNPTYFPMSQDRIDSVIGKRGLFMWRIASLVLLQRLKGSISGDAHDFNNMETRALIKFFFLQGNAPKEIHTILIETLGEHAPLYATVKNWVAQFKCGDFYTCDASCPGRPKTVTTPEIIDQIHELILEDRQILGKSIAEQLRISHEQVGSITHEDLDMQKLSAKWVTKCLTADQKHQWCQSSQQLL